MKNKFLILLFCYSLLLVGCSSKSSTHLVSLISQNQGNDPVNKVLTALTSLENQNPQKFHELSSFQMANNYRVSYIATDPFAPSPFENFLTLQYMAAFINEASYQLSNHSQVKEDASVSIHLTLPNYESILNHSLPTVIETYRHQYAAMNIDDIYAKTSLLTTLNDMIQDSCAKAESTEVINTFKLKYIEGNWYIVDNGELYNQIQSLVQYYNRQLL